MKPVRRAIVTGAEGFLGRHLVHELRHSAVQVTGIVRWPRTDMSYIAMGDAAWCPSHLSRIIEAAEPDVIFHMAGALVGSQAQLQQSNLDLVLALLHALRQLRRRPLLVCCGSAAEYGAAVTDGVPVRESVACAPNSAYGAVKLAQTQAALAFAEATGSPVLVARIFNPIGPGMPTNLALGDFAQQIAMMPGRCGLLRTGDLRVARDFVDVAHVAGALRSLASNPVARGVVNVCTGQATELGRLLDMLIAASGGEVRIQTMPTRLRHGERRVIVGSTERLEALGGKPPQANYADVVARIWRHAEARGAAFA